MVEKKSFYGINTHFPSHFLQGEVLEWLKRHAWKACIRQKCIAGSNPALSADKILILRRQRIVEINKIEINQKSNKNKKLIH